MMLQGSQATSMASIFPSTWIHPSRIQAHSRDFHLWAILTVSLAKWMVVLLAFEVFHPHLRYLCHSGLHLIMIFPRAGIQHLNRSFGRERLSTSFTMWDRCSSKCSFCGGLQAALCICWLSSDTKNRSVADYVFLASAFSCSFLFCKQQSQRSNKLTLVHHCHPAKFLPGDKGHALCRDPVLQADASGHRVYLCPLCRASARGVLTVSKRGKELGGSSREVQSLKP